MKFFYSKNVQLLVLIIHISYDILQKVAFLVLKWPDTMNYGLNQIQILRPKINGLRPIINGSFLQGFEIPETIGHMPLILGCKFLRQKYTAYNFWTLPFYFWYSYTLSIKVSETEGNMPEIIGQTPLISGRNIWIQFKTYFFTSGYLRTTKATFCKI